MNEEQRLKVVRIAALTLLQMEYPGAPSAAVGPPSKWWSQAEELVYAILPYILESLRDDV